MRHTHASQLIAMGQTEDEVARRLGHSSPRVAHDVYIHLWPGHDAAAAAAIDELYPAGADVAKTAVS